MSQRSSGTAPLVVAITATSRQREGVARVELNDAYIHALRSAGLVPLVLPPIRGDAIPGMADAVAGVVLSGGEDVDPAHYGQPRGEHTEPPHDDRDDTELALVRLARDRRLPTLAICRGMQLVNVALGGTLVQDIPSESPRALRHSGEKARRTHAARIVPGTLLHEIVGDDEIQVNTSHHQSLARVAPGLRVSASAPDGIIEAAEWEAADEWWMLAVQWHPEELVDDPASWDRAIFAAFARRLRGSGA